MRNTIKKVMMVVPVFITNCQVSLKPNRGPLTAQTTIISTATTNVAGLPAIRDVHFANRENHDFDFVGLIVGSFVYTSNVSYPPPDAISPNLTIVEHRQ